MNNKNLKGLCEAYSGIYAPQELDEIDLRLGGLTSAFGNTPEASKRRQEQVKREKSQQAATRASTQRRDRGVVLRDGKYKTIYTKTPEALALQNRLNKEEGRDKKPPTRPIDTSTSVKPAGAPPAPILPSPARASSGSSPAPRPAASSPAPRPAASSPAPRPAASAPAKPTGPAVGKLGSTSFERRTPTSAELRAAQAARAGGASPEKALQAAQKTNLPTTGPTPAIPSAASVSSSMTSFKPRDMTKNPLKPTPPTTMKNSYEWGSTSKLVQGIANAYSSIYEAKEKIDQDEDNDNDFADVRIARLIASGVSKEKAIEMVKNKSYNKKNGLGEATRMRRELGKEGETATRQELARRSNAYQRSGSVDRTIAGAEAAAGRTTARGRNETPDEYKGRMQKRSSTLNKLASNRKGSVRDKPRAGLRGYAAKVEGSDKELQTSRQKAMSAGTLTPAEKKGLGEDYKIYKLVSSYLLENNFATSVEDADVIINNMSENWMTKIIEEQDHEHSMIRVELKTAMNAINNLKKKVGGEGNVEAWVQSKITRAADYLQSAATYIDSGESKVK